jgi:transposase
VIVQKAFYYRFFPTDAQAAQLGRTFGCARFVYNQALEFRSQAWQQEKKSVGYHETALKLTQWKKEPDTSEIHDEDHQREPSDLCRRTERSRDGKESQSCQTHRGCGVR